jgi:hypothetical protein
MARYSASAIIAIVAIFGLLSPSNALFEDQAGKDDWTLQHVGKVKFSHFDSRPSKQITYVVSEQGVLAALSSTTTGGPLLWRRVLPEGSSVLKFERSSKDLALLTSSELLVFDLEGQLTFQTSFPTQSTVNMAFTHGLIYVSIFHGDTLRQLSSTDWRAAKETKIAGFQEVLHVSSHATAVHYLAVRQDELVIGNTATKDVIKTTLTKKGLERAQVAFTSTHLVVAASKIQFLSLQSADKKSSYDLSSTVVLSPLTYLVGSLVTINGKVFGPSGEIAVSDASSAFCTTTARCFFSTVSGSQLSLWKIEGEQVPKREFEAKIPDPRDNKETAAVISLAIVVPESKKQTSSVQEIGYLLQRVDWTLESGKMDVAQKGANVFWSRAEALAAVTASIIVDVPAKIHEGLLLEDGGHLWHRLKVHWDQIYEAVLSLPQLVNDGLLTQVLDGIKKGDINQVIQALSGDSKRHELHKDHFGFAKFLIASTQSSSLVCYHSLTRRMLWSTPLPSHGNKYDLYVEQFVLTQKSSAHGPVLTLFGRDQKNANLPFSIQLHPLTGQLFNFKTYSFKFATILTPKTNDEDEIKPVLFVDENAKLFIDTSTCGINLSPKSFHYYLANEETGAITGYSILSEVKVASTISKPSEGLSPTPVELTPIETIQTWEVQLGSPIDALVHTQINTVSPGKVAGADRMVLPKYLNPNAIAVGTTQVTQQANQAVDSEKSSKTTTLQVSVIDTVTGHIIYRTTQRGATGRPYHDGEGESAADSSSRRREEKTHPMRMKIVFQDDWFVFTYWSSRFNRFEMMSVEMFESEPNFKTSGSETSSFAVQPQLDVRSQSFILLGSVRVLAVTKTHLGISVQDLLVVYQDGKTSQISVKFLDPRRPMKQEDDPTLRQYYPYIPLDGPTIINYHNVIAGIHTAQTTSTALESSSIVWLVGTDSFVRLISQHGESFDRLAHDYSFLQIGTICIGLAIATYVFKVISKKKEHAEKWK